MRVHHLNCATFCPVGGALVNGPPARLVTHCLLIETQDSGLVLVDTGLGTEDIAHPSKRVAAALRAMGRPALDPEETALAGVKRLGFSPSDVHHIILTHLDKDHAGGIHDFPEATIHVSEKEYAEAMEPLSMQSKLRYARDLRSMTIRWKKHSFSTAWHGFDATKKIREIREEIFLISLPGHTCGHSGVVIRMEDRTLVHAGDSYFYFKEVDPADPRCTPGLALLQNVDAWDPVLRQESLEALRELAKDPQCTIFCSHDPLEFDRFA